MGSDHARDAVAAKALTAWGQSGQELRLGTGRWAGQSPATPNYRRIAAADGGGVTPVCAAGWTV